ncbi:MAG TPA: FCD domain-containing protein [Bacillus bacterium]|uniref:flavin reductase n=1 Tax=Siminovitchia fordii TaxID=254759 RepID=UPI00037457FF|nr:flavin reductase [Siminovitchia fordii]HBZ12030.1 FCD domain-containing protein [Bacillus sp. (in: firmicutes)]
MISEKNRIPTVDNVLFRDVIGHFASGVTIITTKHEGVDYGITASAVTSLSMEPPMLLVCVNQSTGTCHAISKSKVFGVHILHAEQGELALQFARSNTNKFEGVEITYGKLGAPILNDALAHLECRVVKEVTGGTHSVFLAEVVHAGAEDKHPLAYYRGKFGHFQPYDNERAYREIKRKVLEREFTAGESITVNSLVDLLDMTNQPVLYALAKLEGEQLLNRTKDGDYTVTPLTVEMLYDALETRNVLEVAAIEKTVGKLSEEELEELRKRVQETIPKTASQLKPDKYIEANIALHDYTVALAQNAALLESYRRLTAEAVMFSALRAALETNNREAYDELNKLAQDHIFLLAAYEAGDKEEAKKIIQQHTEEAKKLGKYLIGNAGGSI